MAVIRETLSLSDAFSAVFSKFLNMGRSAASTMQMAKASQNDFTVAAAQSKAALDEMAGAGTRASDSVEKTSEAEKKMSNVSDDAAKKQEKHNRSMREGASAASGLTSKIASLAAAYVSLRSAQALINLSDTWTQTTARLDRMNDGVQTTPQVQDMIFNAAQRSRGNYQDTADMVAKLGTLAPDAFNSTQEVVAFVEQINKQFALAGTSAQGAQAAMLQLTQAMSSGVLRGEELNSVLEQAPTITRSIAEYMGVTIGQLREMASQGQVTAEVVKAAMFSAAEETNAAFAAVPMTFSQAWTMVRNEGLNAMRPVLEELNSFLNSDIGRDALNGFISAVRMGGEALLWLLQLVESGAVLIQENWDIASAILQFASGAIIALTALSVASSIKRAAGWAIEHRYITLFVVLIGSAITTMYAMGMSSEEVFSTIGAGAGWLFALAYNLVADMWNVIASFAEFLGMVFNNPLAAAARLFIDTFSAILGIIETVAGALDALTGWDSASVIAGFRKGLDSWANQALPKNYTVARMEKLDYRDTMSQWSAAGGKIGAGLDSFSATDYLSSMGGTSFDYANLMASSGIPAALDSIGGDTKAIRNSVALSEEDMKLLVDMATREYVNNINLTAQTPVITINGQNTGDFQEDLAWLERSLTKILTEQSASHTDLSYK